MATVKKSTLSNKKVSYAVSQRFAIGQTDAN